MLDLGIIDQTCVACGALIAPPIEISRSAEPYIIEEFTDAFDASGELATGVTKRAANLRGVAKKVDVHQRKDAQKATLVVEKYISVVEMSPDGRTILLRCPKCNFVTLTIHR